MNEDILRAYVREMVLQELRADERMLSLLRGSGLRAMSSPGAQAAGRIVEDWIHDIELEIGKRLPPAVRTQAHRFAARRWQGLLARFHGDVHAAHVTMMNLLDNRFRMTETER